MLIVDDEPLARVGLRTLIPWAERGYQLVGEAASVAQAVELARERPPDLVLVDIVMPERDGFELIRELKALNPACKFIIVSCRSTVDYYKQAITLGVSEYIQKSTIEAEELLGVVERVGEQIRKEKLYKGLLDGEPADRDAALEAVVQRALQGQLSPGQGVAAALRAAGVEPPAEPYFLMLFSPHQVPDIDETGGVDPAAAVASMCREVLREAGRGFTMAGEGGQLVALLWVPAGAGRPGPAQGSVAAVCRRMQATLEQLFDTQAAAGVSACHTEVEEMPRALAEAEKALDQAFFHEPPAVCLYRPQSELSQELPAEVMRVRDRIFDVRTLADLDGLEAGTAELVEALRRAGADGGTVVPGQAREVCLEVFYHLVELLHREGIPPEDLWKGEQPPVEAVGAAASLFEVEGFFRRVLRRAAGRMVERRADGHRHAVEIIKKHVADNLDRRISLREAAESVALSPNYVCRLFKRQTGETLGAYIHRLKVEAAKELLFQGLRGGEAAARLGFSSESHFVKVFKMVTGMTTREYLRAARGGEAERGGDSTAPRG